MNLHHQEQGPPGSGASRSLCPARVQRARSTLPYSASVPRPLDVRNPQAYAGRVHLHHGVRQHPGGTRMEHDVRWLGHDMLGLMSDFSETACQ